MRQFNRIGLIAIATATLSTGVDSARSAESLTFEKDVRPILKAHCFHCHGEDGEMKGGLDVRLARFLQKGGDAGPAIVAGKPDESLLLEVLISGEMPKEKAKLPDAEIATVRQWIAEGAKTARPEPETLGPEHLFTQEERAWWSLQPIADASPPEVKSDKVKNDIDAFIAAKHAGSDLTFSETAEPQILLRRASFTLTGMPPTPEEVDNFLSAYAGDPEKAYRDMVERLLASPAHGERWARHWLDVAGYADSDGVTEKDLERAHAWRYRDYVINAFNKDKPFDAFVREQLAGDEIAFREKLHADSETDELKARYAELITATGFLRMAPDGTGAANTLLNQNQSITDTIKIVSTAMYGMTIQCAECHDHRYDPITQKDFYELRAVFQPGFDPKAWRRPSQRLVSLQTKEDKARAAEIEAEAKKIDAERLEKQQEFINIILELLLEKCQESDREPLRVAFETPVKERSDEQNALLKANPNILKLNAGSLYLYDTTYKKRHAATLKEYVEKAKEVRARKPVPDLVQAFAEVAKKPEAIPATHLFFRGDPESPKDEVAPSDLDVLSGWRKTELPENVESLPTSGRRLALAEMLTDGEHPLLARVMVNRVWMHHFGRGLVKTVADFGHLGEKPSHPELLDYLATEFMKNGWSLKWLHREILASHTWRQKSQRDAHRDTIDPDNVLLSRQNKRRLEAETLRDSLLAVSGKLNDKLGGEPVPVMETEEGIVVIGIDTTDTAGRQTGKYIPLNGEEYRKSIYVQVRRSRPLEMFAAFDAPTMADANCAIRPVTTVSPQSLLLMNNIGMREYAQFFAGRMEKEIADGDAEAIIDRAWRLCYGRYPTPEERQQASDFLTLQTAYYTVNPVGYESVAGPAKEGAPTARELGIAALGHALMSANEFLYVD
ncbi:MAG: PSD1 and planctomycete cytochrome C domain-containing protein [Verrucomicrobiales bacterium]|nr:PSD1 and planctomycete cytochrome C domain-containing protein [Verrucomicrobiales bacterium]